MAWSVLILKKFGTPILLLFALTGCAELTLAIDKERGFLIVIKRL